MTPHPAWTADDLAQFLIGMRALPPFMVEDLGAITLERQRRACHHGMGRYNRLCPTFQDNTFFLYDIPPIQGEGTTRKLGILTRPERVKLLRRRAAIHLVTARFDAVHEWSLRRPWRLINSWNRRGDDAFNLDVWGLQPVSGPALRAPGPGHLRRGVLRAPGGHPARRGHPLGRRAPGNAYDWDLTLACQHFTKIRVLSRFDHHARPDLDAPPARPARPRPAPAVPPVRDVGRLNHVEGIDLLLAAATSDRPESLYGHLF